MAAALAMALTAISLVLVVGMVEAFGAWGFWLAMSAAVVFPPWLYLRSRLR